MCYDIKLEKNFEVSTPLVIEACNKTAGPGVVKTILQVFFEQVEARLKA